MKHGSEKYVPNRYRMQEWMKNGKDEWVGVKLCVNEIAMKYSDDELIKREMGNNIRGI